MYNQVSKIQSNIEIEGKCFLSLEYPRKHPYQQKDREKLWEALSCEDWNPLYDGGVALSGPIMLHQNTRYWAEESFESYIGMDCPPPNWNEGLDSELTKDLHLTSAFHFLFSETNFALTDFIFCREFHKEISMCVDEYLPKIEICRDPKHRLDYATIGGLQYEDDVYKIEVHTLHKGEIETPHFHIYLNEDNNHAVFDYAISLVDILTEDEIHPIYLIDKRKNIDRRHPNECFLSYDEKKLITEFLNEKPEDTRCRSFETNLERLIWDWNRETDFTKTENGGNPLKDYLTTNGIKVLPKYSKYFV